MWSVWQTCRTGRRAAGFLGGLLVALLLAAAPAAGQTFPSSNLTTLSNGGEGSNPVMAAGVTSSGTEIRVYVAWIEGSEVWFKVGSSPLASSNSCTTGPGALVFGGPKPLSAVNPSRLAIATHDQAVYVAWLSTRFSEASRIQLWSSLSSEGSPPQELFFNGAPNNPAVAADSSGVLVAAESSVTGGTGVWLARPEGASFAYLRVSPSAVLTARRPSIASDGTKVHVVWRNGGVQHKKFDRGSTQADLDNSSLSPTTSLTSASVQFPPQVAAHGSEVTVAWIEGTTSTTQTALRAITFPASARTIRALDPLSTTMRLANLSLSVGPAGQLFGWQEADTSKLTSSNHYLLDAATDRPIESGSYYESTPGLPTAGPSVVLDAAERVVASWKENVGTTPTPAIRAGYEGSSGGGTAPALEVRHAPETLNAKTMYQGNGVFNFWIRGVQGEIDLNSVKVNDRLIQPIRSAVEANGDLHLTFYRSDLRAAFDGTGLTAAHRNGSYTIAGSTTNPSGCFSASNQVQINR